MGMLHVGTSGFAYPSWKPEFYPEGLPQKNFLGHYSQRLNSVEINYTFRRLPARSTLENWFSATPRGFQFAVKAHQKITHLLRLKNSSAFMEIFFRAVDPLRSAGRLGPVLFQLPPNLRRDDGLLADFLADLPPECRYTFEFRHESWFHESVYQLLESHGTALCLAESEKLRVPEVITADFVYWRLRMPEYSRGERKAISEKCRELIEVGKDVFLYFKHEETAAGVLWAEELLNTLTPVKAPPGYAPAPAPAKARRHAG